MTPLITIRPAAERELAHHYAYIGERNPSAADRFLIAAEKAFAMLSRHPGMGRAWESESKRFDRVRSWTMPRFRNYRIFYRPLDHGVEILHVFHGKQDIQALLEEEPAD